MAKGGGRSAGGSVSAGVAEKLATKAGVSVQRLPAGGTGITQHGEGKVMLRANNGQKMLATRLDIANALTQFRASKRTGTSLAGRGAVVVRSFPTSKTGEKKDLFIRMTREQLGIAARKAFGLKPNQKLPRSETLFRIATGRG